MVNANSDRLLASGILEKWHDVDWLKFDNCPEALSDIQRYLKNHKKVYKEGIGLWIWGANGVGKTLALNLLFKELLLVHNYKVRIISMSTLITRFTSSWYDADEKRSLEDSIYNAKFLGIEEVGKEYKSATDLSTVVLDNLIRYRLQRKLPVIVTSNMHPKHVTSTYTEDIASMLRECSIVIQVTGNDRREHISKTLRKNFLG